MIIFGVTITVVVCYCLLLFLVGSFAAWNWAANEGQRCRWTNSQQWSESRFISIFAFASVDPLAY